MKIGKLKSLSKFSCYYIVKEGLREKIVVSRASQGCLCRYHSWIGDVLEIEVYDNSRKYKYI